MHSLHNLLQGQHYFYLFTFITQCSPRPLWRRVRTAHTRKRVPRERFFPYRLQFSRHSLLDRWNSLSLVPFIAGFNLRITKLSAGAESGEQGSMG
jgi:hypothetical protein